MQKNILLVLFLAALVFLFLPTNKVKADEWGCYKGLNAPCENITAPDYETGKANCESFCDPAWKCSFTNYPCPQLKKFGCTRAGQPCQDVTELNSKTPLEACASVCEGELDCTPSDEACGPPRVFGCEINTDCKSVITINYELAQKMCASMCGTSYSHCLTRRDACPASVTETPSSDKPGPLAGATVGALKSLAASNLNKGKFGGPEDLISRAIKLMMAFIGSIALVLYIVSGLLWMTASGNAERVTKAKTTMVWTTLGVAMMLASYMLASFIFKSLGV